MKEVEHMGEIIRFEGDPSPREIEQAKRRIDERRAAVERVMQTREMMRKFYDYLVASEAQSARDAETLRAYDAAVAEGRQRYAEIAREEAQARIEEEALRRAEAAERAAEERAQADLANRSYLEKLNDRNRLKMPTQEISENE